MIGISELNKDEFLCNGVHFKVLRSDYNSQFTNEQQIVILKGAGWFPFYHDIITSISAKSLLEFGIFQGGSAILFALLYPELKIVSIDFADPSPAVFERLDRLNLRDRVKLYYNTSQEDRAAVSKIIRTEFPDGLDLVIDDASHHYRPTKVSFETAFPHIKRAGVYIVEDWPWAHQQPYQKEQWLDRPALSNFVFELVGLTGGRPDLVERLEINGRLACIYKSGERTNELFDLDKSYLRRGVSLPQI